MAGEKYIRKQILSIKRRKLLEKKVISLSEFRDLNKNTEAKTILVVDDDEVMRSALKRVLESEGYNILLASDGMEFSKFLQNSRLDLVLLDVNLPWVDGYELCKLLKSHHDLQEIPIIMISARSNPDDIEKGFEAGCNEYVVKPFEVDDISNTIKKALLKAE